MNFWPPGNQKRNKLWIDGNNGLWGVRCGLTGQKAPRTLAKFRAPFSIQRSPQCPGHILAPSDTNVSPSDIFGHSNAYSLWN
jgi:hypothetical protein